MTGGTPQPFRFSTWAIRNPVPPVVLFLVLCLAGMVSYLQLPINNMPSVVVPVVSVTISQPGAAPEELETQVTRIIEGAMAGIQGVKHVTSRISEGTSSSFVEFTLQTPFDRAMSDVRDAVDSVREQLPRTILEPLVQRIEIDGGAILSYSVEAPSLPVEQASWFVDDTVSRTLLALRGVAKVERQGGANREITVALDTEKLQAMGTTAAAISRQLVGTAVDLPGGRLTVAGSERLLRTMGNARTAEELARISVLLDNGRSVRLEDIATVRDGAAEQRTITRLDGKSALVFSVFRSKGSSDVQVARKVEAALEKLEKQYRDVRFTPIFSLVTFTERSFDSTMITFIEGSILTVLVVFWFLRDGRATVLAALAIPLSIIPTFLFMDIMGFSLNAVSLLAISLVTGVLVDDAIVEIENIHRHLRNGKTPFRAAIEAVEEIGLAVVATTLVICAVFAPVSFMGGIAGQFFRQFGLTVAIAAFFSLVVARLLTPMLAAYWLNPHAPHNHDKPGRLKERYARLVGWTLSHRRTTLLLMVITLVGSFSLVPLLKTGFIPVEDYSEAKLKVELPKGTPVIETDTALQDLARKVRTYSEVAYVLTTAGEAMGGANMGMLTIKLTDPDQRKRSQKEFEQFLLLQLKSTPDMRLGFERPDGTKDVTISLTGEDIPALRKAAAALEKTMRSMDGLTSVTSSEGQPQPEIRIIPDHDKLALTGVTVQDIGDALRIATLGDIDSALAKFNSGTRQIPLRVRLPEQEYPDMAVLENLPVTGRQGAVPLSAIARLEWDSGPTSLYRYDRQRQIAVEANLNGIPLGEAMKRIRATDAAKNLPPGVSLQNTGDAEVMAELFAEFGKAIGAGLMLVYAIQVLLYKDWLQPLTRMVALPLSIGGAFLLLLLTATDLSMPAIIGLLMLMGIADKNAILLVDYILDLLRQGMPQRQAVIEGCLTRARPIIMTSVAMTAGMIPTALSLGQDSAFRAPMAIAVIGGLISSTLLSLVFVPVMFTYMADFKRWLVPKLLRVTGIRLPEGEDR